MNKGRFYTLAQNPAQLNQDTLEGLKKLTEDFPHFHAAWLLYLKNLKELNDPEFDTALKKAAPLLPDRKQLYRFLHAKHEPSGFSAKNDEINHPGQEYLLEISVQQPAGDSLIDKFLSGSTGSLKLSKPFPHEQAAAPDNDIVARSVAEQDDMVTETLANIYVGQKKYDKALNAFKKLSLKYPEKNSYFATRIEEIEKLKNI
ncbi:MAG: hypothetical protein ACOC1D_03315 [Prolixibacteraceae bacterium]